MAERVIFSKNTGERVEVWAEPYKGYDLVNARVYYLDRATGDWRPTKKGLALSPEVAEKVARALLTLCGEGEGDDHA